MRSIRFIAVLPILILVGSCKKTSTPVAHQAMDIPWFPSKLMPGHAVFLPSYPTLQNVSGVLVYNTLTATLTDTGGKTDVYSKNQVVALFTKKDVYNKEQGGDVFVNSLSLGYGQPQRYAYEYGDTADFWNDKGRNKWTVTGNSTIPGFTADVAGTMPQFTAVLPAIISRSKDLSITFSYANVVNADSAHFMVYQDGDGLTSNVAAAYGGTATISKKQLKNIGKSPVDGGSVDLRGEFLQPQRSIYPGGLILLTLFNHTTQTFNGKRFAFVNQRQILRSITFAD